MIKISLQYFGGRGSAGGGKGGSGSGAAQTGLEKVQSMSNEEFEAYLSGLSSSGALANYGYTKDSDFQKMVVDLGINDKPAVLNKAEFDQMLKDNPDAKLLYRGVTVEWVLDQVKYSDEFHIGGGDYGDGLYYAGDAGTAYSYTNTYAQSGAIQRVAISPNTKIISSKKLDQIYDGLPDTTKAALKKAGSSSPGAFSNKGESFLALKLGYDAVQGAGVDHLIILNRRALIIDNTNYTPSKGLKAGISKLADKHHYYRPSDITNNPEDDLV